MMTFDGLSNRRECPCPECQTQRAAGAAMALEFIREASQAEVAFAKIIGEEWNAEEEAAVDASMKHVTDQGTLEELCFVMSVEGFAAVVGTDPRETARWLYMAIPEDVL